MHVNVNHPQAKLIRVLKGSIFDVVIDLRRKSDTYKKIYTTVLSDENSKMLFIPEGFGHGYLSLTDSIVQLKVTSHYVPGDEISFSWDSFNIRWPELDVEYILNLRDLNSIKFTDELLK